MWKKEHTKKWLEKQRHPCIDCGEIVGYKAYRCRSCASKLRQLPRLKPWHCVDCGKKVCWGSTRCRSCQTKRIVREGTISGPNSGKWKGGRRKVGGYIYVHSPDHPHRNSNKQVAEHILIWEQAHGRYLTRGWVIHHINGAKDDNCIENLLAMPKKNHSSSILLRETRKRLRLAENRLREIKSQGHFMLQGIP